MQSRDPSSGAGALSNATSSPNCSEALAAARLVSTF